MQKDRQIERRMDRHDEANSRLSKYCNIAPKNATQYCEINHIFITLQSAGNVILPLIKYTPHSLLRQAD
jgi:hypothetical protein